MTKTEKKTRLLVIGGGFAGLNLVKNLKSDKFDITIIDRANHHLFQPLLYQVASAALSPGEIAMPIRAIFKRRKNVRVIMAEVNRIDRVHKKVIIADGSEFEYDYLVVATGARHAYFGRPEWETTAPGLKSIADALRIRQKILSAFEKAEALDAGGNLTPEEKQRLLTFVIVGAGPTGVELAGAIGEIAHKTLKSEFRLINPESTKVILVEGADRVLTVYPPALSEKAAVSLKKLGVEIRTNTLVTDLSSAGVNTKKTTPSEKTNTSNPPIEEFITTANVFWAAGNAASPLLKTLNSETDNSGHALVNEFLQLKDDSFVYVLGDAACFSFGLERPLPGVASVAIQQGRLTAHNLRNRSVNKPEKPFKYLDKGSMATIGRAAAVAMIGKFTFHGLFAWLLWSVVHVMYLVGFRNRLAVMMAWMWSYATDKRAVRLITYNEDK